MIYLEYVIAGNKQFVSKNDTGNFILVRDSDKAWRMQKDKAVNILNCLPKQWKNYHLQVSVAPKLKTISKMMNKKVKTHENELQKIPEIIQYENIDSISDEVQLILKSLRETSIKIKSKLDQLKQDLSDADKSKTDVEHKIELAKGVNACDGWYYFSMLREILQKRRMIKNDIAYCEKVLHTTIHGCGNGELDKFIRGMENRKYTARALGENFNINN